jgi:hypothetical protein
MARKNKKHGVYMKIEKSKVKQTTVYFNGNEDFINVTDWQNYSGFDIEVCTKEMGRRTISLTHEEWNILLCAVGASSSD